MMLIIQAPLVVCYDIWWQARGSGRSYNSMTGHGTLIGHHTGTIVGYGAKSLVKCVMKQKITNTVIKTHNCCKNWDGTSKAMETGLAVDQLQIIEANWSKGGVFVMDDDSTII